MQIPTYIAAFFDPVRAYTKRPRNSELEQAILRLAIGSLLLLYFARLGVAIDAAAPIPLLDIIVAGSAFLTASLVMVAHIIRNPGDVAWRRIGAIMLDVGTLTYIFLVGGSHSAPLYFLFLWIIVGNGFRFGQRYLFIALGLSLLGFATIILLVPYWRGDLTLAIGLWIGMLMVSLYFSMLVGRLYRVLAQAESANVAKRQFICLVSHEMRTPLNAIIGAVDLLKGTRLDREQLDMLDCLSTISQVMLTQIEDVLDFEKIEAGKMSLEVIEFDPYLVIHSIASMFRYRIDSRFIRFTVFVDSRLPASLFGDPHHLRQILINLTGNAVKFTEQGRISINVRVEQVENDIVCLRFSVRDTGIGIPETALAHIFESFYQAEDSTARRFGGTGLGTTICKQLVELMGGDIDVASTQGEGSEFWFTCKFSCGESSAQRKLTADFAGRSLIVGDGPAVQGLVSTLATFVSGPVEVDRFVSTALELVNRHRLAATPITVVFMILPALSADSTLPDAAARLEADVMALQDAAGEVPLPVVLVPDSAWIPQQARELAEAAGCLSLLTDVQDQALILNILHACEPGKLSAKEHSQSAESAQKTFANQLSMPLPSSINDGFDILIAEDNPVNRKVLTRILERAGHRCHLAQDGQVALDKADKGHFDAIILDMNMPVIGGLEVARVVRLMPGQLSRVPIIMFSANVTMQAREESLLAGADEFLGKPIQLELFLQTLDRLVHRFRSGLCVAESRDVCTHVGAHGADSVAGQGSGHESVPGVGSLLPNTASRASDAVLDLKNLEELEAVSTDRSFLDDLIAEFIRENGRLIDALEATTRSGDVVATKEMLHSMCGAALSIGATSLKNLCKTFEKLSAVEMHQHAEPMMTELRKAYGQLCEELGHYRQQRSRV